MEKLVISPNSEPVIVSLSPEEADAETARKQELTAQANAIAYKESRISQYPSIGDQLDALYHAGVFPEEMAAQITAVKEANPKPE